MGEQAIPTTWAALLAIAIIGFITPHVVAFATSKDAPWWLTGPLSAVVAGLGALVAYFTDAKGIGTWKEALGVFLAAVVAAQGYRSGIDPGTVPPLQDAGPQLGAPKTDEPPTPVEPPPPMADLEPVAPPVEPLAPEHVPVPAEPEPPPSSDAGESMTVRFPDPVRVERIEDAMPDLELPPD